MPDTYPGFEAHLLDDGHSLLVGRLPDALSLGRNQFETLWRLHPADFPEIHLHGRLVKIPRWQRAYGADYHFSGQTSASLPVPPELEPFHSWARSVIDDRLNGLLLNWYDGDLGHYIGPHRDSTRNMIPGAPIVTISLGAERTFRLTRDRPDRKRVVDFQAEAGTVFIMPYETNRAWKHGVPKRARQQGRRISITLRAFAPTVSNHSRSSLPVE
jgi:alkylated DNA repair dioxygenase AlkB